MRARVLQLHPMTAKKLWRLRNEAEVDGVYRVARRLHAVLLNHGGNTSGEIATLLDSPRSRVSEWLKNYEDYGYDGLLEGYRPGRPPTLTSEQKHALEHGKRMEFLTGSTRHDVDVDTVCPSRGRTAAWRPSGPGWRSAT